MIAQSELQWQDGAVQIEGFAGMRYAMLNSNLEELMKEGRIKIASEKQGRFDLIIKYSLSDYEYCKKISVRFMPDL